MTTDTDTNTSAPTQHPSFSVHHQSVFVTAESEAQNDSETPETKTVDEAGLLALNDEPFETTLFHHGVDVDTRERSSRIETGGSDEFVDDRPPAAIRAQSGERTVPEDASGLQGTLFADTATGQWTLGGKEASTLFLFETGQRRYKADSRDQATSGPLSVTSLLLLDRYRCSRSFIRDDDI